MTAQLQTTWQFRDKETRELEAWDWSRGAPRIQSLMPTRRPRSGDRSSHVPVRAYSMRTETMLHLESGLEHDLVRRLDRDASVAWIVPQPCKLTFTGDGKPLKHNPDLLVMSVSGDIALWDARPAERTDELFLRKAQATAAACEQVGWTHQIFHGLDAVERLNLLWLHGFRRQEDWHVDWRPRLLDHLESVEGPVALGEMLALDDGSSDGISTLWHLLWAGAIGIDVTENWDATTTVVYLPAHEREVRA